MNRLVLVPGVLALLPEYAGLTDPVAEVRAACHAAVSWLAEAGPVAVVGDPQGRRVGEWLLAEAGSSAVAPELQGPDAKTRSSAAIAPERHAAAVLAVGNGSACRSEKAPGFLDERSFGFDDALREALTRPDPAALAGLDTGLGGELLAALDGPRALGEVLTPQHEATVDYDDDPFGVQYWVIRWDLRQP